jgi:hypothetical protein
MSLSVKLTYVVEFAVAGIEDIEWSPLPFNCLTISDGQREVIMALAEAHTSRVSGATFDDFVEGKGRGLNVLLQYSSLLISISILIYQLANKWTTRSGKDSNS